jgi:hypothetical protein
MISANFLFQVVEFHLDTLHHTSGNMNSFPNCVVKERHGRTVSVLLVTVGLHRVFQHVSSPSAKFDHPGSTVMLDRRWYVRHAKLSRLRRTGMCLTELNRAYNRSLKGSDTAKTYRFRGDPEIRVLVHATILSHMRMPAGYNFEFAFT